MDSPKNSPKHLQLGEVSASLSFMKDFSSISEGERLAKLQRLLKFEELEQEAGLIRFRFR